MRILFAAPDRDLLQCYEKLLTDIPAETVTAFDGTQVLSLLSEGPFDAAVCDRELPRVSFARILDALEKTGTPVIILQSGRTPPEDPKGARKSLSYPFTPEELKKMIRLLPAENPGAQAKEET